ncbi:hypothetical protein FRC06_008148 [Ceratobasidium sp. 370]|nr:hypothetical protein FRC06_008148 [Ceratobasidium sp. 370]
MWDHLSSPGSTPSNRPQTYLLPSTPAAPSLVQSSQSHARPSSSVDPSTPKTHLPALTLSGTQPQHKQQPLLKVRAASEMTFDTIDSISEVGSRVDTRMGAVRTTLRSPFRLNAQQQYSQLLDAGHRVGQWRESEYFNLPSSPLASSSREGSTDGESEDQNNPHMNPSCRSELKSLSQLDDGQESVLIDESNEYVDVVGLDDVEFNAQIFVPDNVAVEYEGLKVEDQDEKLPALQPSREVQLMANCRHERSPQRTPCTSLEHRKLHMKRLRDSNCSTPRGSSSKPRKKRMIVSVEIPVSKAPMAKVIPVPSPNSRPEHIFQCHPPDELRENNHALVDDCSVGHVFGPGAVGGEDHLDFDTASLDSFNNIDTVGQEMHDTTIATPLRLEFTQPSYAPAEPLVNKGNVTRSNALHPTVSTQDDDVIFIQSDSESDSGRGDRPVDVIDISDDSDDPYETGQPNPMVEPKEPNLMPQEHDVALEELKEWQQDEDDDDNWVMSTFNPNQELLQPLSNRIMCWVAGYDWEAEGVSNPIWELTNQPLMTEQVMDHTVTYLAYQALLTTPSSRSLCVIPPTIFNWPKQMGASQGLSAWLAKEGPDGPRTLQNLRDQVWIGPEPPARVILPVIDHPQMHCYLWYGNIERRRDRSNYHCRLFYLDSLSQPAGTTIDKRLAEAKLVLQFMLPQINGEVTGSYQRIPGYRQSPGSLDCGFFVCQAVSALAFGHDHALQRLRPVALVRSDIKVILDECADKALLKLSRGLAHAHPILLHRNDRAATPPWRRSSPPPDTQVERKPRLRWTTPDCPRSLSEPAADVLASDVHAYGWEAIFGPSIAAKFHAISPESAKNYLDGVRTDGFSMPPGLLAGTKARLPGRVVEATLLTRSTKAPVNFLPGITIVGGEDEEGLECPDDGMSTRLMCHALSHLKNGRERSLAVLTGTHNGQTLHLNWAKDTVDLEEEYLTANLDIDSLSLTTTDPQFTMPATLHAYPPRASTLTTDNGLSIMWEGEKRPLSHFPNFTLLNMGLNNQFRVNILFPSYYKGQKGGRYITIMSDEDYTEWWESVMLRSLFTATKATEGSIQESCRRLWVEIPKTYSSAKARCSGGDGTRTFTGFKAIPEVLNLALGFARRIVDQEPRLAKYRNFFYHIWGINLKAVAEAIPERSGGDAVLHVLQLFPIVDWSMQNPLDIVLDVGLEIGVRSESLPLDVKDMTLLWKLDELKGLVASSWRKPRVDAYMHSHVVGGIAAKPRAHVAPTFYKLQAYMKEKVLTYIHRDNSIGAGFSPQDGLLGSRAYCTQTNRLLKAWKDGEGSYGVRMEWRVGLSAAMEILDFDPQLFKRRFLAAGVLVSVIFAASLHCRVTLKAIQVGLPTSTIMRFKAIVLDCYDWFFQNMQRLPQQERESEPVALLASVLAYLMHGLVQRPDDMSSSRDMAKRLQLVSRAIRYGMASVPPDQLGQDFLRIRGVIAVEQYPILQYIARKNPAGARIKASVLHQRSAEEHSGSENELGWNQGDQEWAERLVNITLAGWLWARMPVQDLVTGVRANVHHGPLLLQGWQRAVDKGVDYGVRPSQDGFNKVLDKIFPPNWVSKGPGRHWESLHIVVLQPIQERLEDVAPDLRAAYSSRLRRSIVQVMKSWQFLPCIQNRVVWSQEGSGKTKKYMLYRNPNWRA